MQNSQRYLLHLKKRLARNRKSIAIRNLLQEHRYQLTDLVLPLFVCEQTQSKVMIPSLPKTFCYNIQGLLKACEETLELGISAIALFPKIHSHKKNELAREAINPKGIYPQAISAIKSRFPQLLVFSDCALDPYNKWGHDGIVSIANNSKQITIDLPASLNTLAQMALLHAQMGADFVSPSDMLDGRIGFIRQTLDQNNFDHTGILAYTVKYATNLYNPFRQALDSHPVGDKKSYQLQPANARESIREALLDEQEGADILMIKPALTYLDIVTRIREKVLLPLAAYHVSGEYVMLYKASETLDFSFEDLLIEQITCLKRAGIQIIFTYAAQTLANLIRSR